MPEGFSGNRNRVASMRTIFFLTSLVFLPLISTAETRIWIGDFSRGLSGWSDQHFKGITEYKVTELQGRQVVVATSKNSASGKVRKMEINLKKTPYLHWSWRLDEFPWPSKLPPETSKAGDDYALRIYVIVSGGGLFWRTRAINYVWSRHQNRHSHWPNAYTNKAAMMAVETGQKNLGVWRHYRRNVLKDFEKLFGISPAKIHAVAIMTDTDNTGASIKAYYSDIYFGDN